MTENEWNPYDQEDETYESADFAEALETFCQTFKPSLGTIYYPGSSADTTLTRVPSFGASRIIHLDVLANAVNALLAKGLEAHVGDSEEFDPGEVDLLIMTNFNSAKAPNFVKPRGFVICNDWWGAATNMRKRKDFELKALLNRNDSTDQPFVDTENLEDYWKLVESDDEWKTREEYTFEKARERVKHYFGVEDQILENYKRILEAGKARMGMKNWGPSGETLYPIPRKRNGGLFVYQRES